MPVLYISSAQNSRIYHSFSYSYNRFHFILLPLLPSHTVVVVDILLYATHLSVLSCCYLMTGLPESTRNNTGHFILLTTN